VVLVDETAIASAIELASLAGEGLNPTRMFYRNEKMIPGSTFGSRETCPLDAAADGEPAFVLGAVASLELSGPPGQLVLGVWRRTKTCSMIGAIRAGSWLDVKRIESEQPASPAMLHFTKGGQRTRRRLPAALAGVNGCSAPRTANGAWLM